MMTERMRWIKRVRVRENVNSLIIKHFFLEIRNDYIVRKNKINSLSEPCIKISSFFCCKLINRKLVVFFIDGIRFFVVLVVFFF